MAFKEAWDDSDVEEESETPPSATAPAPAPEPTPEPAAHELADDHPASSEALLFWGCFHGSLRCVARALAGGARPDARLNFRVLEELETIACTVDHATGVQAELGDSALHVAARQGELGCVLLLLMQAEPADPVGRSNRKGETVLDVVSRSSPALREVLSSSIPVLEALRLQRSLATARCAVRT